VVDTGHEGFTTSGTFTSADGPHGSKRWRGSAGAAAMFAQTIAVGGTYEVFARWPISAGAGFVEITIESEEGSHTVPLNQRHLAGEWVSLGAYPFQARSQAKVTVRGAQGQAFVVDAVRWQQRAAADAVAAFASSKFPIAVLGEDYATRVSTAGGKPPFKFSVAGHGLPQGLSLDTATGLVSGRPVRAGLFAFTLNLLDERGQSARADFTLGVAENVGGEKDSIELSVAAGKPAAEPVRAQAYSGGAPDLSALRSVIAAMPEGEWARVNLNRFDSAWTPEDLRVFRLEGGGVTTPGSIMDAWSSFAWDSNRGNLFLYGGGHATYAGNDTYQWQGSSRNWTRSSLPSQIKQNSQGNWESVDGPLVTPNSAHTYDNMIFLPIADRVLVLGGGVYNHVSNFLVETSPTTSRKTGPYFFDTGRADGNKVGGLTGSHVQRVAPHPEVVGGNMWSNRESWLNTSATSKPPLEHFLGGCTGYAVENGHDVVYYRSYKALYRYEVVDVNMPSADRWSQVGVYWASYGATGTCAYDAERQIFLSSNVLLGQPFAFWSLATPGADNREVLVTPVDPTGEFMALWTSGAIKSTDCALDFDPARKNYLYWCGDGRVWTLTPPAAGPITGAGWTIAKARTPVGLVPNETAYSGILGKWKYIPNLDVFMGLAGRDTGNIWLYKPKGWSNPGGGNLSPIVEITTPVVGAASVTLGTAIPIAAQASDPDGSVSKVEFFANGTKIGERTAVPYGITWTNASLGAQAITAIATDNAGATRVSAAVTVNVLAPIPVNVAPTASWLAPANGANIDLGVAITLSATAADSDGSIAKVEFYDGSSLVGTATAAPYSVVWTNAALGAHTLNVVATDDKGATASASRSITIKPVAVVTVETTTIQRGFAGGNAADISLFSADGSNPAGAATTLIEQAGAYSLMVRFPIFVSEGGPVPNGAVIDSATLSLYKSTKGSVSYSLYRVLQEWSEPHATWNRRTSTQSWGAPGANGSADVESVAVSNLQSGAQAAWQNFDLTANVQAMSNASTPANYGWRLRRISGGVGITTTQHRFYSSEYASTAYRPKLVVTYRVTTTN
jgi:Bacterial Ig domain/Putative Ig domain